MGIAIALALGALILTLSAVFMRRAPAAGTAPDPSGSSDPGRVDIGSRIDPGRQAGIENNLTDRKKSQAPVDPSLVTAAVQGQFSGLVELESLLTKSPNNTDLINLVAYHYYNDRRLDEALELYERGLAVRPDDPIFLFYMGNTLYLKGRVPAARDQWIRVTQVDADGKVARKAQERLSKLKVSQS